MPPRERDLRIRKQKILKSPPKHSKIWVKPLDSWICIYLLKNKDDNNSRQSETREENKEKGSPYNTPGTKPSTFMQVIATVPTTNW